MDRGDVHLVSVEMPNRATGVGLVPRDKYVVCLRGGQNLATTETDVPVVIASTNRRDPSRPIRKFEVEVGVAEGFSHDTVIDCRWVYTLEKSQLPQPTYRFTLPTTTMDAVNVALVVGLQMYTPRTASSQAPVPRPPALSPQPPT